MPLAIIAGLAFLALEIAVIAWLLHWLLAGTVSLLVMAVVITLAVAATAIAWASIGVADRADDEMESFMAKGGRRGPGEQGSGESDARHAPHAATQPHRGGTDAKPGPKDGGPAPVSLQPR